MAASLKNVSWRENCKRIFMSLYKNYSHSSYIRIRDERWVSFNDVIFVVMKMCVIWAVWCDRCVTPNAPFSRRWKCWFSVFRFTCKQCFHVSKFWIFLMGKFQEMCFLDGDCLIRDCVWLRGWDGMGNGLHGVHRLTDRVVDSCLLCYR